MSEPLDAAPDALPSLDPGKRKRLTRGSLPFFAGTTLFDRLARTVCQAECLPRKELYESWEMAKRVRRRLRGGTVVDLAAGHGLLAWALLVLDGSSPRAICVDQRKPLSAERLEAAMLGEWPRLAGRVEFRTGTVAAAELPADALLVSAHACGKLTDEILDRALEMQRPVAVLPCCQSRAADTGGLEGWLRFDQAIDVTRAQRMRQAGYQIWTAELPAAITPKNRLLLARPGPAPALSPAAR